MSSIGHWIYAKLEMLAFVGGSAWTVLASGGSIWTLFTATFDEIIIKMLIGFLVGGTTALGAALVKLLFKNKQKQDGKG